MTIDLGIEFYIGPGRGVYIGTGRGVLGDWSTLVLGEGSTLVRGRGVYVAGHVFLLASAVLRLFLIHNTHKAVLS